MTSTAVINSEVYQSSNNNNDNNNDYKDLLHHDRSDTHEVNTNELSRSSRRANALTLPFTNHFMNDCKVPLPAFAPDDSRLPLRVIAFFAIEIGLVLQYLHSEGFIYRDLKP